MIKPDDRVKFIADVENWNGKAKKARIGETGRVSSVSGNKISVVKDGKVNQIWDVPVRAVEVIQ